ncbi:MAG: phenylalanyl-tRNA synthetase beta chain [Lentisphaeria bacterium]|jgi:phenylalanyl-tRNA synthetase beta chain
MKLSESWLREWVQPKISTRELVDQLTMAGLEVDSMEAVAGEFSGVVVGEIVAVTQHPDADKLRVCRVLGAHDSEQQVVCGAPNARVGIKVPFATVGAKLPGDFKIKKAKLRGVESFGMLCAQAELQAGEDDNGLWELPLDAPAGADLREYLSLDDIVIAVDLTPNRSDCLSVQGLAREIGALNKCAVVEPLIPAVVSAINDRIEVTLTAAEACSRYVGRVIKNVDISRPTPMWMVEKLRRSGVRSIDAVVDVTNYVLLELGQPLHAFDLNKLTGNIDVRLARQGEKLTLLDASEVELNHDTLVIADDSGAIAMAGVMGGASTAVYDATVDIFLESAFFSPLAIAGRARGYGMHTDASHRFERGVDYQGAQKAIERASALLLGIVGGDAGPLTLVDSDHLPCEHSVSLSRARIEKGLGFAIPDLEVVDVLTRLGLTLNKAFEGGWEFTIPSYRFDISIEQDLLEELARIYGYNRLPTTEMRIPVSLPMNYEGVLGADVFADHLVSRAYQEVITYSFIDPKMHKIFDLERKGIELLNPISADLSTMRTSLLPGLVSTLLYNINRQKSRVRIFESGLRFIDGAGEIDQSKGIAGLIYGARTALDWNGDKAPVDFYDIKGDVESLLAHTRKAVSFKPTVRAALHPGQTAEIFIGDLSVGVVGALHPQVAQQLDILKSVFVFELSLDKVTAVKVYSCAPVSRFPETSRDLAVLVDRNLAVAELQSLVIKHAGEYLKNLKVFDVYGGEGIDPERKSVAFNLTFQHPSRNLKEEEVSTPMAAIIKELEHVLNATLR